MTAAANFHGCLDRLWPLAARRGISHNVYATYTAALTPDLRIMDLLDSQPEFTKSLWDYLDHSGQRGADRAGPGAIEKIRTSSMQWSAPMASTAISSRQSGAWKRITATLGGRPPRDPLHRDACLHRPPAELFPRGIPVGAGNPSARRCQARPAARIVGRCLRPDPVHADRVQTLRSGFRSRRPPRRGRRSPIWSPPPPIT